MNRKGKAVCALLLVQLLAWGVFVPTADAGGLKRLSAQTRRFDGGLDVTSAAPLTGGLGGLVVYTKSFSIPAPKAGQQAVVFITVDATAEEGDSATALALGCQIDSNPCSAAGLFGLSGWVRLDRTPSELDTNGIHYTWCTKVSSGAHTATVRIASSDGTNAVGAQEYHFFIDRTELKTSTADDCELGAP